MKAISMRLGAGVFLLAVFQAGMFGCSDGLSSEQALRTRAEQYWQARKDVDMHTVFKLESEARPRGPLTEQAASSIGAGFRLLDVAVKDVSADGNKGEVVVEAKVQVVAVPGLSGKAFDQRVRDHWVRIDGKWYHRTYMGAKNKGFGRKPEKAD